MDGEMGKLFRVENHFNQLALKVIDIENNFWRNRMGFK